METVLEARDVFKVFYTGPTKLHALKGINLQVKRGEFTAIMGPSGSGKTTLLNIFGLLDRPSQGQLLFDGEFVQTLSDSTLSSIRANEIGIIFQTFNLIPYLTTRENIELPFLYSSKKGKTRARVLKAAQDVGLSSRLEHRPSELSGGEMQHVAIARALCIDPKIILADEPTGNLDSENSKAVLELIQDAHKKGATILLITHDPNVAAHAERILFIQDGEISGNEKR
ncbi:MAG: ABC transporter ATP-binding protein [Nitrospinota bacterium]